MVIVVAMIAIALPLCQALVCDMVPGAMTSTSGIGFGRLCNPATMTTTAPAGVVPTGSQPLFLAIAMLIVAAVMMVSPSRQLRFLRAVAEDPPPPPEDPRGVRLII